MTLSETGKWLEQALLKVSSEVDSALQLDPETLYSLVSYCEMAPPGDASEYLLNIVGNDRCKDIVAEYLRRRGGTNSTPEVGMHAYHKPREEELWSTGTKRPPKQKAATTEGSGSVSGQKDSDYRSPLYSGNGVLSAENIIQKGKRPVGKGKKLGKGVGLAEASKGLIVFARGRPCNCQCTRHKLINNCLKCGKIVCEQEGEGPCLFCGTLVLREGSDYGGLEGLPVPPATESEVAAEEFKNRLVEYDRTSASRTTVIDDQSDYFQIEGNTWLSEKEKKLLKERQDEEERAAEERRKRVMVTIDLLGRKVVSAGQENGKDNREKFSILGSEMFAGQDLPKVPRVKPNPYLAESPVFIDPRQSATSSGLSTSEKGCPLSRNSTGLLKSSRIQHDDPLVEALVGHNVDSNEVNLLQPSNQWQGPKARALGQNEEEETFFECQADMAAFQEPSGRNRSKSAIHISEDSSKGPAFDICPPHGTGKQKPVVLSPSTLMQRQVERKEARSGTNAKHNRVLLPGMVLLKTWLTSDQQLEIVKICRSLGIGHGGFYKPEYGENSKMHLQMMCLGMQWEPTSKSYKTRREYDDAHAPTIPDYFLRLVDKALLAGRVAATRQAGGKSTRVVLDEHSTLPDMVPNVCIVNFYEHSGKLGIHQDKDESAESLRKGCPIVSFSIGDSGEFTFGKERDVEKAEKVILESGDVLIFGGPSRMIFHGLTQVTTGTCPKWLSQKTNLRPGRLNLTFRQA